MSVIWKLVYRKGKKSLPTSTWEVETGRSWVQGYFSYIMSSRPAWIDYMRHYEGFRPLEVQQPLSRFLLQVFYGWESEWFRKLLFPFPLLFLRAKIVLVKAREAKMLLTVKSLIPAATPVRNGLAVLEEPIWRAQGRASSWWSRRTHWLWPEWQTIKERCGIAKGGARF